MSYVISLVDYVPSPRYDGVVWTTATIGEAAAPAGPYTTIATVTLTPVDTDPTSPQSRSFTANATLQAGWYLVTFFDSAGGQEPTSPVPVQQPGATPPAADGDTVVTFSQIAPPARADGLPWTTVQVSEASALSGPWTVIDTQTLSPIDTDPTQPQPRDITTSQATTGNGFYSLTFLDSAGGASQPVQQVENAPSEIEPTVAELGAFMPERTVALGSGGAEQGTFNTQTRPTGTEAAKVIKLAVSAVLMQTGEDIPDHLLPQAQYAVLLNAAMLIELGFYRNEVNKDQSSYAQYQDLFNRTVTQLTSAINNTDAASPAPSFYSVPIASSSQARFQAMVGAINPQTGVFDPTQVPVEWWYPRGPGLPADAAAVVAQYPWFGFGDTPFGGGDFEIDDLEAAD